MQFDVHPNHEADQRYAPFLVDVQSDLLSRLRSRVLVPLVPLGLFGEKVSRLHPKLRLFEDEFVLATHLIAAIDRQRLRKPTGSLAYHRDAIVAAVDVILAGV